MIGEKIQLGLLGRRLSVQRTASHRVLVVAEPEGDLCSIANASSAPVKIHERLEGDEKARSAHGWRQL